MASTYQDFVPEGKDPGALGGGFADYVPAKEPTKPAPAKQQPKQEDVIVPDTTGEAAPTRDEKGQFTK